MNNEEAEHPPQNENKIYIIAKNENEKVSSLSEKEFDPFQHRSTRHPTSYWETLVHMFKGTVGTGILSLPVAFAQSGYAVGLIGLIMTTYINTYCAYILAKTSVELCRRQRVYELSYQAACKAAFTYGPSATRNLGDAALHTCNVLLLLGQIGSACIYVIFIAANIKAVVDYELGVVADVRLVMLGVSLPLLLVAVIRNLKYLAPFSSLGSVTVLGGCSLILYHTLQDLPPLSSRRAAGSIADLPKFLGTVFFASSCISLILPLQYEMKTPKNFLGWRGVLPVGSVVVATLYGVFGVSGYLKYGDEADSTVTLNLPKNWIGEGVQLMLATATLLSTGLMYYVTVTVLWESYLGSIIKTHRTIVDYGLRIFLVILTVAIAILVPNLELLVSITGVLSQCTLTTTFPCILHIFTYSDTTKTSKEFIFKFFQEFVIIFLTIIVFVSGMWSNISQIVSMYS